MSVSPVELAQTQLPAGFAPEREGSALGSALERVEALLEQEDMQSKEQVACRRALQRVLMQAEEQAGATV